MAEEDIVQTGKKPKQRPVSDWRASWIWDAGEADPSNCFLMVRKAFVLSHAPSAATLHISAADRYQLFVNGTMVGRGPARSNPIWKSYDSHDVAGVLTAGKNAIAVLAYHYGPPVGWTGPRPYRGTFYAAGERAGLWAELEMSRSHGDEVVATDASWRVQPAAAYARGLRQVIAPYGPYPEWFDARLEPADWRSVGFDDSSWPCATLVPDDQREWLIMEARDVPVMHAAEVLPTRVVSTGEVIHSGTPASVADMLAMEIHLPLEHAILEDANALIGGAGGSARTCSTRSTLHGQRDPFIIVDFGRQLFGYPHVHLTAPADCEVDMTYGQQLVGGRVPLGPYGLNHGDRYITREGEQRWEPFEYKQFRYLHLCIRGHKPVVLHSIGLRSLTYPEDCRGRFACSDPDLGRAWQACVDTALLQLEDTISLDAWRERINWSVSDTPQAVYAALGDAAALKRHHRLIASNDRGHGLLGLFYPPDETGNHTPQVVAGLLLWLDSLEEHYRYTGDKDLLEQLYPAARRQMDYFGLLADGAGMLSNVPYQNYCDQAPNDLRGTSLVINGLYLLALQACSRMADTVGDADSAARWRDRADTVRRFALSHFWNDERGLYEDAWYQGRPTAVFSELTNGLVLLTGIATDEQVSRIAANFRREAPRDLVKASPIMNRFILFGLARVGCLDEALEYLRGRYKMALDLSDAPTVWEVWERFSCNTPIRNDAHYDRYREQGDNRIWGGGMSLVHGGTSPALLLSREVLGVKSVGAGFQECRIEVPCLESVRWARGVCPTVRGDIDVEWRVDGSEGALKVRVPPYLKATLVAPSDSYDVSADGTPVSKRESFIAGGEHWMMWRRTARPARA